jgi:hypothetical protein
VNSKYHEDPHYVATFLHAPDTSSISEPNTVFSSALCSQAPSDHKRDYCFGQCPSSYILDVLQALSWEKNTLWAHSRTYVRTYVCMYVCTYVRMHVCMCVYACMYVCVYACMYACMYVCVCVCVCMYVCICVCVYVCTDVCMCVCMYVCMYVRYSHVCVQERPNGHRWKTRLRNNSLKSRKCKTGTRCNKLPRITLVQERPAWHGVTCCDVTIFEKVHLVIRLSIRRIGKRLSRWLGHTVL